MTTNIYLPEPLAVRISRSPKKDTADVEESESVVGYLVDEEGNDCESPEIGKPVFLTGEEKNLPWLFRTDAIWKIEVYNEGWKVVTEEGSEYLIQNNRQYQ